MADNPLAPTNTRAAEYGVHALMDEPGGKGPEIKMDRQRQLFRELAMRTRHAKFTCLAKYWALLLAIIAGFDVHLAAAQEGVVGGSIGFSALQIEINRFVLMPDSEPGVRPRLNYLTTAPGDHRLFVVDEGRIGGATGTGGKIYAVDPLGAGSPTISMFLDVGAVLGDPAGPTGGRELDHTNAHSGVRSVAFHPDFANAGMPGYGKFYAAHLEETAGGGSSFNYLGSTNQLSVADSVLVEWSVDTLTGEVDTTSYRELFRGALPVYEHPIKQAAFNPLAQPSDDDYGLLFIAHGDGGTANGGTGQNGDEALGKLLRINPLQNGNESYSVPASNPFTIAGDPGDQVLDEVYALGFRNPHRFSWADDSQGTQRLILSDIGQDNVEEINIIESGDNHGWRLREGTFVNLGAGNFNVDPLPPNDALNGFTYPAAQYGHPGPAGTGFSSTAVVGGFVVQNASEPLLDDQYIFGDFPVTGRMFHASLADLTGATTEGMPFDLSQATIQELTVQFDDDDDPMTASVEMTLQDIIRTDPNYSGGSRVDTRIGQGPAGEMYILNKRNGWIYQVRSTTVVPGDGNGDRFVNAADYTVWANNFGLFNGNANPSDGDFTGDGFVDASDYTVWANHFGQGPGPSGPQSAAAPTPEPSALVLFAVGAAMLLAGTGMARGRRAGKRVSIR